MWFNFSNLPHTTCNYKWFGCCLYNVNADYDDDDKPTFFITATGKRTKRKTDDWGEKMRSLFRQGTFRTLSRPGKEQPFLSYVIINFSRRKL